MPTYTDRGLPLYSDTEAMPGWDTGYNAQSTALDTALDNLETDIHDADSVATYGALPVTGNWPGRLISVETPDSVYRWDGSAWTLIWTVGTGWLAVTPADGTWNLASQFGYRGLSMMQIGREVWIEGIFSRTTGFETGYIFGTTPAGITPPTQKTPLTLCVNTATFIEGSLGDNDGDDLNKFRVAATLTGFKAVIVTGHYFI